MLKEIFGVVEKTNTRPLLTVFVALSLMTMRDGQQFLADPFQWSLLGLPVAVMFAYGLVWYWVYTVMNLNSRLADNDIGSWGPTIGCTVLAFCLLVSFQYLSSHPQGLSFEILGKPNFVRLMTLYLLAAETIKIRRR